MRRDIVKEYNNSIRNKKRADGISLGSSFWGLFSKVNTNDTLIIQQLVGEHNKHYITKTMLVTSRNDKVIFGKINGRNESFTLNDVIAQDIVIKSIGGKTNV